MSSPKLIEKFDKYFSNNENDSRKLWIRDPHNNWDNTNSSPTHDDWIDKGFKFEFTFQEKKFGIILDTYSEEISTPVHHRHTTFIAFCFHISVRKGIFHNGQY